MAERLLTPSEAADRLDCSPEQLRTWVRDGRLNCFRIGTLWRFDPTDLTVEPDCSEICEDEPPDTPEPEAVLLEAAGSAVDPLVLAADPPVDELPDRIAEAGIVEGLPLVYALEAGEGGPVKIGLVSHLGRLRPRIAALQAGCPATLRVLRLTQGGLELEAWIHRELEPHRIRGEWFEREPALEFLAGRIGEGR